MRSYVTKNILPALGLLIVILTLANLIAFYLVAQDLPFLDRVFTAAYGTLQLYVVENSFFFEPESEPGLYFKVARLISPAIVFLCGVALLSHLRREWERTRSLFMRKPILICGLGSLGLALATLYRKQRIPVVAITIDPLSPTARQASELGVLVIAGDASEKVVLARARAKRSRKILIACFRDANSVRIASALSEYLLETRKRHFAPKRRTPQIYVHIESTSLRRNLQEREYLSWSTGLPWIEYVNIYESLSERIVRDYSPKFLSGSVVISGNTGFTSPLLMKLNALAQLGLNKKVTHGEMKVFLVDQRDHDSNPNEYTTHTSVYHSIEVVSLRNTLSSAIEKGEIHSSDVSLVIVCPSDLEDELGTLSQSLEIGRTLHCHGNTCPIVLIQWSSQLTVKVLRIPISLAPRVSGICPFGIVEHFSSSGMFERNETEKMANAIWDDYVKKNPAIISKRISERELRSIVWDELSDDEKDKNIASARDTVRQLSKIGYELVLVSNSQSEDAIKLSKAELETLAELEHNRWMNEKSIQGYSYGPKRNDKAPNKRHPCIMPYHDLPEIERKKDSDTWISRLKVLAEMGYAVLRIPNSLPSEAANTTQPIGTPHQIE